MEWKPIKTRVCCNREKHSIRNEKTYRRLFSEPVPKKDRCRFPARWIGVDTGRERILRCDFHHLTELMEDECTKEILDAKMFVLPYVELLTPVSPDPQP